MADITINDLPEITSINPASDFIVVWEAATGQTSKIKINNLLSSNGVSGKSVPYVLSGEAGNSRTNVINTTKIRESKEYAYVGYQSYLKLNDITIGYPGMFATTSATHGRIDDGIDIIKKQGATTLEVGGHTLLIGGGAIDFPHPEYGQYGPAGSSGQALRREGTGFNINISADTNNLYIKSYSHFNYQIEVFI